MKKVLLVDGNQRWREGLALRLMLLDLEILQAADATEALSLLEKGRPDLVVMDRSLSSLKGNAEFRGKLSRGPWQVVYCGPQEAALEEVVEDPGDRRILLPREDRQALVDHVSKLLQGRRNGDAAPGKARPARQILIIEDSPTLRGILRRALEKGFPDDVVREAEEGRQALSQMSQKKVDLIVTDLEMPGMDGMTFLNHLRGSPLLSRKPILVFSGKITAELRKQVEEMPNVRLLAKPASPEKIVEEAGVLMGDGKGPG